MNDSTQAEAVNPAPEGTDSIGAPTAGQLIRAARQKLGVHLAVLSLKLKVSVRQLEALEADEHDLSKGPVFVRALAASVCRQLNMDPAPVLALLPQAPDQLPLQRPHRAPLPSTPHARFDGMAFVRGLPRPTLAIAGVMLVLIAALLWLPSPSSWSWFQPAPSAPSAPSEIAQPVMPEASVAPLSEVQAPPLEPAAAPTSPAVVPLAPAPVASAPVVASPSVPVAPVAAPAVGAVLGFSASQDSWIEIRDSHNQVLWSRLMRSGESTQVQYPLPMRVVVGRADAVKVSYQGKALDLAPHTKVTVARFEVKE